MERGETEVFNYTQIVRTQIEPGQAWEFDGDPNRVDGWSVIGRDSEDEHELALVAYDSLHGATSRALADGPIPGEWIMERAKAEELHDRIQMMDTIYWPEFNPLLVRVENGEVVERLTPPERD